MSENISVLRLQHDRLLWLRAGDAEARDLSDPALVDQLSSQLKSSGHRMVFAAPGPEVRLSTLTVSRDERRHLSASLPFMLEEAVAEDIENLHFARRDLAEDRLAVAIVRAQHMQDWQDRLQGLPALSAWVPEPLLLPWQPGDWTLVHEPGQVLLRYGEGLGTTIEAALAPALLTALAAEHSPQRVILYGDSEADDRALLPAALAAEAQWRRGGLGAALLLADAGEALLDLRQGAFAPRLPYERWWGQWRAVAAVLALAVILQGVGGWLDLRRLQADNLALRTEIQERYRDVNPRGAVVDAEKQLQRQLDALGGGEASAFSALLAPLGQLMAGQAGSALASLNYSQSSGELRVNLLVPDFDAVERLRAGLVSAGLSATLESSSRAGERVRARLRIVRGAS